MDISGLLYVYNNVQIEYQFNIQILHKSIRINTDMLKYLKCVFLYMMGIGCIRKPDI